VALASPWQGGNDWAVNQGSQRSFLRRSLFQRLDREPSELKQEGEIKKWKNESTSSMTRHRQSLFLQSEPSSRNWKEAVRSRLPPSPGSSIPTSTSMASLEPSMGRGLSSTIWKETLLKPNPSTRSQ